LSGKISTKEMTEKIADIYKSRLSPESWKLVEKEVASAGNGLIKKYPSLGNKPSLNNLLADVRGNKPSPAVAEKPASRAKRLGKIPVKGAGKPQVAKPEVKVDPVQARKLLSDVVQQFKNQGQKDTQIRDYLSKLGITPEVISLVL
jgi:hypothetical protein